MPTKSYSDPDFSIDPLPRDGASIVKLAARSMFDSFSDMAQGMMLVDRSGRVVWINQAHKRFLPALGFDRAEDFVCRYDVWHHCCG